MCKNVKSNCIYIIPGERSADSTTPYSSLGINRVLIESLSKRRFCQHGRQPEVSYVVIDGEWWRQPFLFEISNGSQSTFTFIISNKNGWRHHSPSITTQLTSGCRPCWQKRRLLKLSITWRDVPSILWGNMADTDSSITFPLNSANTEDNSSFAVNRSISFKSQKQSKAKKIMSITSTVPWRNENQHGSNHLSAMEHRPSSWNPHTVQFYHPVLAWSETGLVSVHLGQSSFYQL